MQTHSASSPRLVLVVPPFFSLDYPCLSSGMIRGAAREAGWRVQDRYLNQDFAKEADFEAAWRLSVQSRVAELGEYVGAAPLREAAGVAAADGRVAERMRGMLQLDEPSVEAILALAPRLGPFLRRVAAEAEWGDAELCLIGCQHQQLAAALALARVLREQWPELPVFLHGEQVASPAQAEAVLHASSAVTGVIWRDAVTVAAHGLQALRAGDSLPGVLRRDNGPVRPLPAARAMPRPDYDDFFEQYRPQRHAPVLPYRMSWGCWWAERARHCTFCGLVGEERRFIGKPAEQVADDLAALSERYQALSVVTADLLAEYADIEAVLDAVAERDLDLDFFFEVRPDLSRARLQRLGRTAPVSLLAGIETLDSRALAAMGKGTDRLKVIAFLKHCAEFGLHVTWTHLIGFPEEDGDSYLDQARLVPRLCHLQPPHAIAQVRVERGSPFFERPEEFGMVVEGPDEALLLAYPFAPELTGGLAGRFRHRYADGRDVLDQARPLIAAVESWRRDWRPGRLTYRRGPDFLAIQDHRLTHREIILQGWRARAYQLLVEPRGEERLRRELAAQGESVGEEAVAEFLVELDQLGLVVGEQGRWLALAHRARRDQLRATRFLALEER